MTNKEKIRKLIRIKMEISKLRAEQYKKEKNKNIDLAIGLAAGVASIGAFSVFRNNPEEIAHLVTSGALFTSSLISFYNYKNFDYIMAYYDNEVSYLREEMTKTLK